MDQQVSPIKLIKKYYSEAPEAYAILIEHSRLVCRRALKIARSLNRQGADLDLQFIAEAAMLHDIGMIKTATPELGCHGKGPYIQHGIRGKTMLEREGLPRHARVCERHIGVGLTIESIIAQDLPLPARDMRPETLEEKIICYSDLFYSKGKNNRGKEKSITKVRQKIAEYGDVDVTIFNAWVTQFEPTEE